MQSNPFSNVGADIQRLTSNKADRHEVDSLRRHVDSLEHSLRTLSAATDALCNRIEQLEETERSSG